MLSSSDYKPNSNFKSIKSIDMHTGGEPLRVILDGFPKPEGNNVLEYRNYYKLHQDHLRTALMYEPRGHSDMYGVILTPSEIAEFGVVFTHNEGYSTMCGHATIAVTRLAIECGWVKMEEPYTEFKIEAPCGLLSCSAYIHNSKITRLSFKNVPSFVLATNQMVEVSNLGKVRFDIAYGGAFYAFVNIDDFGIEMIPSNANALTAVGMEIKHQIQQSDLDIKHPLESDLSFLYGTIFTGKAHDPTHHSRNVCVFAEGELDRSPTGSGVSARAAMHFANGDIARNEEMVIESIIGSTFGCKVIDTVDYQGYNAVIPEVSGTAFITGRNEFLIDPEDPLKDGFLLR